MSKEFSIIAGPCSVESEEQVLLTAQKLSQTVKPDFFRAGVWKPRTRPGSFEGVGVKGLLWLKKVQSEYGIPAITEAGCANHVEKILKHGLSAFWVGARTVANPFSVQEIVDACDKKNISVFVKNPIHPDIELWIGAIERFLTAGIENVYAIHRGFYPYEKTHLRNIPRWEIPIELARRLPQVKIIADPSHIAGNSKYISEIAAQAKEMEADGLMIEVHSNPSKALSDALQQITPKDFAALIQSLSKTEVSYLKNTSLELLRKDIDDIDLKLLQLFAQRFEIVNKMGVLKRDSGMTIMHGQRWSNLVENRLKQALELGINVDFVKELLKVVHDESIRIQLSVNDEKKKE